MMDTTWFTKIFKSGFKFDSLLSRFLLFMIALLASIFVYLYFLHPLELKLENKLNRYPTQWSHLAQLSKTIQQNPRENINFPFLNEQEFEVIRTQFKSLGLRPNIFRLINGNQPKIEIQINEVDFTTWLHVLDDLRIKYHLYTDVTTIQKGIDVGTVQVSVTLVQKR